MSWNEGNKSFLATEDLQKRRRVKIVDTTTQPPGIGYAQAEESCIGATKYSVKAGEQVAIKLISCPGSQPIYVAGIAGAGEILYADDDGVLTPTPGTIPMAMLLTSLSAPGVGEVMLLKSTVPTTATATLHLTNETSATIRIDLNG